MPFFQRYWEEVRDLFPNRLPVCKQGLQIAFWEGSYFHINSSFRPLDGILIPRLGSTAHGLSSQVSNAACRFSAV